MKTTTLTWVSALAMSLSATTVYALTPSGGFAPVRAKPEQLESAQFHLGGLVESPTAARTAEPLAFAPIATAVPLVEELEVLEKKPAARPGLAKPPSSGPAPMSQHRSSGAPSPRQSKVRSHPNEAVARSAPPQPRVSAPSPQQGFSMPLPTSFQSSAPPAQAAIPLPSSTSFGGKGKR